MNCKYLRIRTKKGVHYKYCTLLKKRMLINLIREIVR